MKTIIIAILALTINASVFGQNTQDSTAAMTYYGGMLTILSCDSVGKTTSNSDIRLGFQAQMSFLGIDITGRGIYNQQGTSFGQIRFHKAFSDLISLDLEHWGRPIAVYFRPVPVTAGGQFEPSSLNNIPGTASGLTLALTSKAIESRLGTFYLPADKTIEYNGSIKIIFKETALQFGALYSKVNWGFATGIISKYFTAKNYIAQDIITNFVCVNTKISPYVDLVYDKSSKQMQKVEVGFTKDYSIKNALKLNTTILFGAGYQIKPQKLFKLYLFIHI